jgi:ribonuclease VapC
MGLNIKNAGVEAAIRKLAARTGESLTDAIDNAVQEKLARLEQAAVPARSVEEFLEQVKPATAVVEATMVLSRAHENPKAAFDLYVSSLGLTVAPISDAIVTVAQEAFLRFGKGRHPAKLNLCDCFSYATAKVMNAPLLFVGNDFSQTDIRPA